jgi:hypothetical protein
MANPILQSRLTQKILGDHLLKHGEPVNLLNHGKPVSLLKIGSEDLKVYVLFSQKKGGKIFTLYLIFRTGKRPIGTGLPSALVRRLGHQPPRPSPSRSRDTESDASDSWDTTDSESGSCSSQSSNQEVGRSKKKRIRMRMYADEEEERSRRKNLHARLADPHPEKNGLSGKARTSRPVHTRLGPNVDVLPAAMPISTRSDLRQRLGSSAPKSPVDSVLLRGTLISADQEGPHLENAKIDLRSKLQSRLGSK